MDSKGIVEEIDLTPATTVQKPVSHCSPLLPPKPEEPQDEECCGTGCTPCVIDIYRQKLKQWEEECERILKGDILTSDPTNKIQSANRAIISPYDYEKFLVKEITTDCLCCKIIHFMKNDSLPAPKVDDKPIPYNLFKISEFPVKQGQHVVIKIKDICRQYTLMDVSKDGSFMIIFKIYESGLLTPLIDKLVVGDEVEIRGPFGKEFCYKSNRYKSLVIFAAGTGIAPFCRIISDILENEDDETRILLCFACRNENEIMLLPKLKDWSRSWNFQIQYFLSHAMDQRNAQSKHFGAKFCFKRIDKSVIEEINSSSNIIVNSTSLYLACGTKSFEKDIVNHLKKSGVTEDRIKTF